MLTELALRSPAWLSSLKRLIEAATINIGHLGAHRPQIGGKLPPMMHRMVLSELEEEKRRHLHDAKKIHRLEQLCGRKGVEASRGFGRIRFVKRRQSPNIAGRSVG